MLFKCYINPSSCRIHLGENHKNRVIAIRECTCVRTDNIPVYDKRPLMDT